MTDYVRGIDRLPKDTRLAVTVGVFDGVHRGHQQVFQVLEETARRLGAMPVAVTFDPHPDAVVTGRAPDMLMDRRERIERIGRLIGGLVVLQTFDEVFRRTTAEEFVERLGGGRNLAALVMTRVSAFGRDRGGTLPILREMGAAGGWELVEAPTLDLGGARVSSARTRELVTEGKLHTAGELLGRPFALVGSVVHGEQRGRELGYPTANLDFAQPVALPPDGIYAARASWGGATVLEPTERADAVISLGTQPTFGGRVRLMEVHLLDRDDDVYGQRMRVQFCTFIRGQRRYDSVDELVMQMGQDVRRARAILDDCATC
ncbi:MAG: riboflavin biosynthesis protein RibF [Chloroflexota bacterium]|jgi:riboflavin kinase/FMN adenylyltransferase